MRFKDLILMVVFGLVLCAVSSAEPSIASGAKNINPLRRELKSELSANFCQSRISKLPDNWVCIETPGGYVRLIREKVVYLYNGISRPYRPVEDFERLPQAFIVSVQIEGLMTVEDYKRVSVIDDHVVEETTAFETKMRHFRGKGDWLPKTPADREMYAKYRELWGSYQRLPDGHDDKFIYFIDTNVPGGMIFFDKNVEQECKDVVRMAMGNMELYDGEKNEAAEKIFYGSRQN